MLHTIIPCWKLGIFKPKGVASWMARIVEVINVCFLYPVMLINFISFVYLQQSIIEE